MTPATYNLLEAIVHALIEVADASLEDASELQQDLTQRLTGAKVAMQRDQAEDIVQDMAGVVVALSKFVLGRKPTVDDPGRLQRKHLRSALEQLESHYKRTEASRDMLLHPSGRCTCAGEGTCEWCKTHCVHCGAEAEQHGPGSTHYFEPHGEGHEPDPEVAKLEGSTEELSDPEYEVTHGGELREKEPKPESEVVYGGELDGKWIVISDGDVIVAALPDDTPEEMLAEMTQGILAVWNEWHYGARSER